MTESFRAYQFGDLILDPDQMSLVSKDGPVHLASTAFHILSLLVQNAGRVVTKDDIFKQVWHERAVEDSNISQNIFVLRNILSQHGLSRRVIVNESGRGYRFTSEVRHIPRNSDKSLATSTNGGGFPVAEGGNSGDEKVEKRQVPLSNLPLLPTPLIGREREVLDLTRLLACGENRLFTLTGGPGSGKTVLAERVVAEVAGNFPDGVVFIRLATILEPDLVPSAVAQALVGVCETGDQPIAETLADYFSKRQVLLVLDNFEQILPATRYLTDWLARAARLLVLVTSRALLNVRGEQEFPVMPLPLPDVKETRGNRFDSYPSVELFVRRARLAQPDFSLNQENSRAVAGICARVDGLPGAIELAAAKVRILEPPALLARMEFNCLDVLNCGPRDLARHQQTMYSTVEWSYNLLNESDKILLRRLSLFVGGFTMEAAETVCGMVNGVAVNVLEGIASLRQNSLVWPAAKRRETDAPRFTMLEIVREYGLACLRENEDQSDKRAYVTYFRGLAEEAEPRLVGSTLIDTIERLDAEAGNMLAAVRWAVEADPESAISIIAALRRYWQVRAYHIQARKWLADLLHNRSEKTLIRARGIAAACALSWEDANYTPNRALITEGLQLFRDLGEEARWLALNIFFGNSLLSRGEFAEARQIFQETLSNARQKGDFRCVAASLLNLGACAYYLGDLDGSIRHYTESLAVFKETDDGWGISLALNNLGFSYTRTGHYRHAWSMIREGLELAIKMDFEARIAGYIETAAELATATGKIKTALRLIGAAETLRCHCLTPRIRPDMQAYQEVLEAARERLSEQDFQTIRAEGSSMTMAEVCEFALGLEFP